MLYAKFLDLLQRLRGGNRSRPARTPKAVSSRLPKRARPARLFRDWTDEEKTLVRKVMQATFVFLLERHDEDEYTMRMGVSSAEMLGIVAQFERDGELDDDWLHRMAIQQSFNELLNGVGISEQECRRELGIVLGELNELFERWLRSKD